MTPEEWMIATGIGVAVIAISIGFFWARSRRSAAAKSSTTQPAELPQEVVEPLSQTLSDAAEPVAEPEKVSPVKVESAAVAEPTPELVPLDRALEKTRSGFLGRIKGVFSSGQSLGEDELEELEEILYTSDLGPQTVQRLMSGIDDRLSRGEKSDFSAVRQALRDEMQDIFSLGSDAAEATQSPLKNWTESEQQPLVLMIVGVNGAGKTTTIGKLANHFASAERKVLVAAGDTFRAAAEDQLKVWSERAAVDIFSPPGVKDPSAVAFDACEKAKGGDYDVLIIDTAGRLHTQTNLMEELKKMQRVIGKSFPSAPHEVLLVLDANSGQNALIQAKNFHEALGVTGVILTKLDGSAKGGVAVGVACELQLPIRLIGVGESIGDLRPFSSAEFVDSIL